MEGIEDQNIIKYSLIPSGIAFDEKLLQNKYRGVEQLVARRAHNPKVVGSSPASATKLDLTD